MTKREGLVHLSAQKNVGVNPTPKTVQKNVGFHPTSIWVGFNPTPKTVQKNHPMKGQAKLVKKREKHV